MTRTKILLATLLIACASLPGASCADAKTKAERLIASGDKYFAQKKYDDAVVEYRKALQYAPTSGEAHLKLAEGFVKADDLLNAYREYIRAADLLPDRDDVQFKAGNMLLLGGRFEEAKARAKKLLQKDKNNVQAMILLGNSLAGLRDFDNALSVTRRAAEANPDRVGLYGNIAVLELAKGDMAAAEREFKHAIEVNPKSIRACLALAQLYQDTNRKGESEALFKRALAIDPKDLMANQAMAAFYIQTDHLAEAEPYLQAAAKKAQSVEAKIALADYYLATGRPLDATAALKDIVNTEDGYAAATTRLAVIEYASGRRSDGHKMLQDLLSRQPRQVTALVVRARFLLSDGRLDDALDTVKQAVAIDSSDAETQALLGRIHLARREIDAARAAFGQAVRLGSRSADPEVELAKMHLQSGDVGAALTLAEKALQAEPNNLGAQLVRIEARLSRPTERDQVEAELKALLVKFPKSADVYNMVGLLALSRNDVVAARKAWDRALELEPNHLGALGGIQALYAAARDAKGGRAFLDSRLAKSPDDPGLVLLAAKARIASGDGKGGEELLKHLLSVDPSNLSGYSLLGQLYVVEHRIDDAKKEFAEVIRRIPASVPAHTMMGLLDEAQGNVDGAVTWYKKTIQLDGKAAVASNNLAWILLSRDTDLAMAVQFAEAARMALPNQPEVVDTLGWAYYKQKLPVVAIRTLRQAVELDPKNPIHQYHLGMAYAREGEDLHARTSLQLALRLSPKFEGAEEARKTLARLLY